MNTLTALLRACAALTLVFSAPASAQQVAIGHGSVVEAVASLKPGQFIWAPALAPAGPMLLIVNLASQRAVLFRNGVPIAASTVSTGKEGRETPTGVFTVLQKHVEHYSSKYDNAPMPYMQRLTWYGVALHAGKLPGYPASHGCIRLPAGFAKLLYGVTTLGMTVVVTDHAAIARVAPAPQIVATPIDVPVAGRPMEWHPERSPTGPVSILVSAADDLAVVLRNGVVIGSARVHLDGPVDGTWAYTLASADRQGNHWLRLPLSADQSAADEVPRQEWQRFHTAEEFRKAVAGIVQPGTTIVVTEDSIRPAALPAPVAVLDSAAKAHD